MEFRGEPDANVAGPESDHDDRIGYQRRHFRPTHVRLSHSNRTGKTKFVIRFSNICKSGQCKFAGYCKLPSPIS